MDGKNCARALSTCIIMGRTCHQKSPSTALLRATLGTLRAGSPFGVLPQPSLQGMSALSAPSASRTHPYGWGPKSKPKNPKTIPNPKSILIAISHVFLNVFDEQAEKIAKTAVEDTHFLLSGHDVTSHVLRLLGHWSLAQM